MALLKLCISAFLLSLLCSSAFAAGTNLVGPVSGKVPATPNRGILQFTSSSSAGTYATLYTAGSSGSKCYGAVATTSDGSAAHLVTLQVVNSTVKYGGTSVNVPVSSGFAAAAPPVALMTSATWPGLPLDDNGNPFLFLVSGDTLQATFATAITSATLLNLIAICADF